jgi:hypothetical protein
LYLSFVFELFCGFDVSKKIAGLNIKKNPEPILWKRLNMKKNPEPNLWKRLAPYLGGLLDRTSEHLRTKRTDQDLQREL